jgi:NAD(P)-dependent dehydrogenase (short-subunit alcohol dehydrogenase family)
MPWGAPVLTIACDVREPADVQRAISRVVEHYGALDVLINDAGVIQVGPIDHMSVADFDDALDTHFRGPLVAMLAALPHLRRSGAPRIVNISSIGGKVAIPHLVPYCASKFALTGLSEGLQAELARDGIRVTTVCPGLMRTGSTYNATFKGRHRQEFAWFHVSGSLPGLSIDARRAARQIIDACRHGDPELIITAPARLAVMLNGVAPKVVARMMRLANRVLPARTAARGNQPHTGWESVSRHAPSLLTASVDRASVENNELPSGADSSLPTGAR